MSKKRFVRYVHSSKEDHDDIVEFFEDADLRYTASEVVLLYEYDTDTKECKLIGADDKFLSDEEYSRGELTVIPEPKYDR